MGGTQTTDAILVKPLRQKHGVAFFQDAEKVELAQQGYEQLMKRYDVTKSYVAAVFTNKNESIQAAHGKASKEPSLTTASCDGHPT